jgi:hypothetical protein
MPRGARGLELECEPMPGAAERLAACSAADSPQQAHQLLLGVAPRSASGVLCCGGPAGTAEGGVRRSGGCGAGGADAHGGRAGRNWQRLNFPTDGEIKRVQERGALLTEEDKAAAAEVAERQGPCK